MADHEPQENETTGSSGEGEGPNLLGLPAKIRVHALAKLLGLTSKQIIAKAAERGTELRSPHSTLPRDVAEGLHAALSEPAEVEAEVPVESAAAPAESVDTPVESAEAPADTGTSVDTPEPPVDASEPQAIRLPSVGGPTGLFTSLEQSTPLFEMPEPSTSSASESPVAAPLFLQPDVPSSGDDGDDEGRPRRRRPRRGGTATAEPVQEPVSADQPTEQTDTATTESEPERSDEDQDDHPRRRRRGRRGRGRGRGDSDQHDENSQDDSASEPSSGESESAAVADATTETDDTAVVSEGATPDDTVPAEDSSSDATDDSSDDDSSDDDQAEGTSRRRRRRRRRRGTSDTDTSTTEDDSVPTVVHERDPRPRARVVKDEVQGISGSTRLEAKRQRRRDGREAGRRRPPILTESEFLARREAVDRVMVVRERASGAHAGMTQVAVLEDGVLVEHFVTSSGSASMVGNIYLGRVQNVLPSMEAAFIDIGRGRNGVLYAGEVNWEAAGLGGNSRKIEQALKPGDQVVVQVSKDPVGHKGARLTTQISLAGRFLVYVPGGTSTGISRKLPDTERKRLKDVLREIVPSDAGVIIRTAAEGVSEDELARDVTRLQAQWEAVREQSEKLKSDASGQPKTLYEEPDLLVKVVRDLFNEDFSKLVIEGESAWNTVEGYIRTVAPDLLPRVDKYRAQSSVDVFGAHRIDEQLAKALDRKVWLPSGGTLVIDRTEAMTVVDVNTGKFTGSGGNLEETVTRNNLEAAEEIVRQMRLRDIGGMIVVDFIDMVLESNRDLVLRRLTEALGRDRTRHQVSEVTSLGLVQMTRKRLGTGLIEAFSTTCEQCSGRGLIVHAEPVETKPSDDSGRSQSGGSRRKRGRDKSVPQETPDVIVEAPARSDEEAAKRAAHPVALAMAAQHPESDVDPVKVAEPLQAADPEKVATAAASSQAGEDTTTVAPAVTEQTDVAERAEIDSDVAAAEAAVAPTGTPAEPAGADAQPGESAAPRRRRARRVARAAAAPSGDGEAVGSVFVVPVPASEPEAAAPATEDGASAPAPVTIVRRPRSRRAAGRPAGPPVDAEA